MDALIIKKGGKLIKSSWNSKLRKNIQKDVSDLAYRYQYEPCVLDKDVTLKDVLLLINKNLKLFDLIFGNWTKELVQEGLKGKKSKNFTKMKYLELYWRIYKDKDFVSKKPTFGGHIFPSFHGIGIATKADEKQGYKKGQIMNFSVSFISVADLRHLPLKLEETLTIYNEDDWKEKPVQYGKPEFSLGHILYGIIWELSFYGGPKSRDKKGKELFELSEGVKSGKIKTYPLSDLLEDVKNEKKSKKKK